MSSLNGNMTFEMSQHIVTRQSMFFCLMHAVHLKSTSSRLFGLVVNVLSKSIIVPWDRLEFLDEVAEQKIEGC